LICDEVDYLAKCVEKNRVRSGDTVTMKSGSDQSFVGGEMNRGYGNEDVLRKVVA
jgi:hypothetical protein